MADTKANPERGWGYMKDGIPHVSNDYAEANRQSTCKVIALNSGMDERKFRELGATGYTAWREEVRRAEEQNRMDKIQLGKTYEVHPNLGQYAGRPVSPLIRDGVMFVCRFLDGSGEYAGLTASDLVEPQLTEEQQLVHDLLTYLWNTLSGTGHSQESTPMFNDFRNRAKHLGIYLEKP